MIQTRIKKAGFFKIIVALLSGDAKEDEQARAVHHQPAAEGARLPRAGQGRLEQGIRGHEETQV